MNALKSVTKWMGGAAFAAVMFFGLSHKAEAQQVSFGVQIGGPTYVAQRPAYPAYSYYNNGYRYEDWRRQQWVMQQRMERERWEREHRYGNRGFDRGRDFYNNNRDFGRR